MAPATSSDPNTRNRTNPLSGFIQFTSPNSPSFLTFKTPPSSPSSSSNVLFPLFSSDSSLRTPLYAQLASPQFDSFQPESPQASAEPVAQSSSSPTVKNMGSKSATGFPSAVKISGLKSVRDQRAGPAFVGQVFSMCDLSGTGLMAVSTHFDIPFLSKRTPEWLKKMFAAVSKSERNGPVFRFFMDLGDAVSYVKRLNIPSGVVGACRLDLAFEHFKEKPHLFQFVPNERQVKEANKLLKSLPQKDGCKKVEGVPVFSAHNLDIAIATSDGIRWYTPYFFDKSTLDNILEESVDQHFHSLIQTRNVQRRRDILDDNLAAEVMEEMGDSLLEPPEVQEVMDEVGNPGIPLSVLSKAAELQLLHAVDKVLLGNRWLRKVTGIQPKFPYVVDSFERRSATSFLRACKSSNFLSDSNVEDDRMPLRSLYNSEGGMQNNFTAEPGQGQDCRPSFMDWLSPPWLKQRKKPPNLANKGEFNDTKSTGQLLKQSHLLPRITMVGIATGEAGHMNKATLKKTMDDLTKELERIDQVNQTGSATNECNIEERDPLFVANVGDYAKTISARLVRREAN
ncbi:OLC1v1027514C2 [Oldenlandia corymbosa var. corymbosa]|uniref:OLC1v1027514C2 n=1 Tax=Oldenlandia corymbosa var. corymbosa TaxID=529605 RepID=A0AAV1C9N6_OLDCO|nr:OLC1v1027514C2 [Oldenlandia corymbosa var. corymbosa]